MLYKEGRNGQAKSRYKKTKQKHGDSMAVTDFAGLDRNRSRSFELMEGRKNSGLDEHDRARRHSC